MHPRTAYPWPALWQLVALACAVVAVAVWWPARSIAAISVASAPSLTHSVATDLIPLGSTVDGDGGWRGEVWASSDVTAPKRYHSTRAKMEQVRILGSFQTLDDAIKLARDQNIRGWLYMCAHTEGDMGLPPPGPEGLQAALGGALTVVHDPLRRDLLHPDNLDRWAEILDQLPRPLVMSCASGKRVASVWIAYSAARAAIAEDATVTGTEGTVDPHVLAKQHAAAVVAQMAEADHRNVLQDEFLSSWIYAAAAARVRRHQLIRQHGGARRAPLIFRQLYEADSFTFTYVLADANTKDAVLIDPVIETADRDACVVRQLGLTLTTMANTHMHADHVTGTGVLKKRHFPKAKSAISGHSGAQADIQLKDGDIIPFGSRFLMVRSTPGHTNGCLSFVLDDLSMVFTGDTLLIRGCGRTDFQNGSAEKIYLSNHQRLLSLPDRAVVYPAHDYRGFTSSSIGEERRFNGRLTKSLTEFQQIMDNLNLPRPKQMDFAIPKNIVCGIYDETENASAPPKTKFDCQLAANPASQL